MRMKIVIGLAGAAAAALAVGCAGAPSGAGTGREQVVAGFYPLAFAARTVGGRRVEVDDLTPPGAEPHDLEVSPGDVQRVRSAGVVLLLGHGFQPQLEAAAKRGGRVVRLLDTGGLALLPNGDPHVWLDPLRYALIVKRIGAALHSRRAAAGLVARLRRLHDDYRSGLSRCARREIVTGHQAFGYLAQRYGLRQIGVTGLRPEAEPAPQDLRRVVELARSTDARTVFVETLASPRIARTVAREAGVRTAVLDPIEGLTPAESARGEDYFSLMRANLATLRQALGCR